MSVRERVCECEKESVRVRERVCECEGESVSEGESVTGMEEGRKCYCVPGCGVSCDDTVILIDEVIHHTVPHIFSQYRYARDLWYAMKCTGHTAQPTEEQCSFSYSNNFPNQRNPLTQ